MKRLTYEAGGIRKTRLDVLKRQPAVIAVRNLFRAIRSDTTAPAPGQEGGGNG